MVCVPHNGHSDVLTLESVPDLESTVMIFLLAYIMVQSGQSRVFCRKVCKV